MSDSQEVRAALEKEGATPISEPGTSKRVTFAEVASGLLHDEDDNRLSESSEESFCEIVSQRVGLHLTKRTARC